MNIHKNPFLVVALICGVWLGQSCVKNTTSEAEEGKLVLAGPFFGNDDLRGIYIFDVESLEEARDLTHSDPAIQAGSLVMEFKEWYGSAALVGVNETHNTLMKKQITEN